ncbi:hypothetical protein ACH47Z_16560 [Streptomyces sp. NPDC020192]|uniref:hypothetical protein n=1 Tax=Streptomyces sp. NPDC020192 TaxID=3365066 RepID=UPI00378D0EC9
MSMANAWKSPHVRVDLGAGRTAWAVAFVMAMGAMSACGSGAGTAQTHVRPVHAATKPSTQASSDPAGSPKPLTESQLEAAAITAADVPGLEADTTQDSTGVADQRFTASSGGPVCTEFLNASNAYAGTYGSSAEVVKGFAVRVANRRPLGVTVTLVGHTSVAGAQKVVDDTRRSAKGCAHLTVGDDGTRVNLAPMSLPVMGDDSTVTRVGLISGKNSGCMTVGLVRVGAVSLNIMVTATDGYYFNVVRQVAKASVSKLQEQNLGS